MDLRRRANCSVRHGDGRWPTGPVMARFRPEVRSRASMADANAGAGSSRAQDWQASSRTSLLTKRQTTRWPRDLLHKHRLLKLLRAMVTSPVCLGRPGKDDAALAVRKSL